MKSVNGGGIMRAAVALIASIVVAACAGAPAENKAAADEVTAAWATAFDGGDATALAALYAEDAHSMPPGAAQVQGRRAIESYWRADIGAGGIATRLMPAGSVAQGDLLNVDGTYEVIAKAEGVALAKGQYQQLWRRIDGEWRVQHEIWRLDPAMQRSADAAARLASLWTTAYNAGDATGLSALYDADAVLVTRPGRNVIGRKAIASFWAEDLETPSPTRS